MTNLSVKENLYTLQQSLLGRATAVLQVGLNMPGGYELYPWQELFAAAVGTTKTALAELSEVSILSETVLQTPIGPYCLFALGADGHAVKKRMVLLEEQSAWGRLWDLDVITRLGPVDRQALGLLPRACLVCSESAHVCRKRAAHRLPEVIAAACKIMAREA